MICALINIFKKAVTGIMVLRVTDLLRNGYIPTIEDIRVTLFTVMCGKKAYPDFKKFKRALDVVKRPRR